MHRSLAAAIALSCLTPLGVVAQSFQFTQLAPRTPASLVPQPWTFRGYAAGDDFDGNGHCDLLVTSQFGVAQCMGTATGFVAGNPLVWTEQQPRLFDLDGDGDRDVAFVPPFMTSPTAVLLYQSTPSGLAYIALPSAMNGVQVQSVALGDVDANGFADMVVAARVGSATPSLMLARGSGPVVHYTLDLTSMPAGLPFGLWTEVLDADGDGDLDVLASNATSGLRLLHNVGGSFVDATATLPPARIGHTYFMKADFDGDGRDDCAATLSYDIDMLWGGASGLTYSQAIATLPGVTRLRPADFDGDGDLDILVEHSTGLDMLWNQGNRQFTRSDIVRPRTLLSGIADINDDGKMDVVYALTSNDRVVRCKFAARSEDGASSAALTLVSGTQMAPSAAGDIDGDGRSDLVSPQLSQFTVDHALGGGLYRRVDLPLANQTGTGRPWRTQLADMDRDGDLDLVVRDDQRLAIADNDGAGAFAWSLQRSSVLSAQDDMRLGDVDADGDLDIVYADPQGVLLLRNNGGGQYALPITIVAQLPGHCVELADVDGDNDLDVLAASGTAHVILANNGAGVFTPNPAFAVAPGTAPTSLRAGDFDGDGDQDLAVADATLHLHRNNGSGSFTETTASDLPAIAGSVLGNIVAADLDEDGDLDLVTPTTSTMPLLLLINGGTGSFTDQSVARCQPPFGSTLGWRLDASDYDDDGDLDLIPARLSGPAVIVNHMRQCRANTSLRLGNVADIHLISGPNVGSPGLGLLGVGFALAAPPLPIPGLEGQLELDPATLQIIATVATSPVGVSSAFVSVPQDPVLFGLEVWFQGGILPSVGLAGFTNATSEVIVR